MAELENKKKVRAVLRGSFTRCANELDNLLSQSELDFDEIKVFHDVLSDKFEELRDVSNAYFDLLLNNDVDESELTADIDSRDIYVTRFKKLDLQCSKLQQNNQERDDRDSISSSSVQMTGKRTFKLPVIQFKKFDGNIREWLPFWSQFRKVDEDANIDLADKVEYLIQATVPGSRARHLVDSFPATGDNYKQMVDSLKSRFGRDDLLIEVYVRELLKLILNNAVSKYKTDISILYDNIETQLRALETLGITSDKYSAMLFPLIESCLPEELLRVWQRSSVRWCVDDVTLGAGCTPEEGAGGVSLENRLKALLQFLRSEVESEQRILLAAEGFGLQKGKPAGCNYETKSKGLHESRGSIPKAADLVNSGEIIKCIFCDGSHDSCGCHKARQFSADKRRQVLLEKGGCFRCLKVGHQSRRCRKYVKCLVCSKQHVTLMCPDIATSKVEKTTKVELNAANYTNVHVFLQTLYIKLHGKNGTREVRALLDTGSQHSYILHSTAQTLGLEIKHREKLLHCLFGGAMSQQSHQCYEVELSQEGYTCKLEVLDQPKICNEVSSIFPGPWLDELRKLNIVVTDVGQPTTIELLIGADVAGRLYTGRNHTLSCGLVAIETLLGWTLMGKVPIDKVGQRTSYSVLSCFVNDATISNLWELDILGISELTRTKSRLELEEVAQKFFTDSVRVEKDGRYEVRIPWLEGHPHFQLIIPLLRED